MSIKYEERFLAERMGSVTQLGGLKRYTFSDGKAKGVEAIEFELGNGLGFTVLPDRGMDIAYAHYKGTPLAYMSKTGITAPPYHEREGNDWLRNFFGGLVTTCGMTNAGVPTVEQHEVIGERKHGLHGRVSNTPAEFCSVSQGWQDGEFVMSASGTMREASLHGENITLTRRISATLGKREFTLCDSIKNEGTQQHNLMMLYHINLGYPLLDECSRIALVHKSITRLSGEAVPSGEDFLQCALPDGNAPELAYSVDIKEGADGIASVALINPTINLGLEIEYKKADLPFFNLWKVLRTGEYVVGFEPGTCLPIGKTEHEKQNAPLTLEPLESYEIKIKFRVLEGEELLR